MHDIDRTQMEFTPEMESFEYEAEAEGVFSEAEQMELASELMGVSNEAELEQFLGDLISKAGSAVGKFVSSPTGKAIGGYLKGAAKKALPGVGSAVGGYFGGSTGADIGSKVGSWASGLFEAESENEMETAKKFVQFAGEAVKNALNCPPGCDMRKSVGQAVAQAANKVPGLMSKAAPGGSASGQWVRRGNRIVLMGV